MDRYEIQKVVGQGSYGRAILCKRKKDSKQCIIKQISLAKLSKREAKMTEQEAQLLGKLSHPNIVAFWESFVNNSSLHIVMEFADGGDLDSYIKNYSKKSYGKEMPESQVLNLFVQVCLAIKHIHDRKILHRDLKGQNIFLTSSGLCKVGDFGVSRVLRSTIELAATQIGTPYYMSPEIMNNQKYNSKTDIWSLGVILYELVCLRLPFQGNSMKQLCYNIISGTPAPPPPSFSKDMKELLTAILAKDPKKRPSINHILSRSLIKNRIQNFLNETKIQREFSHTILHGVNVLHAPNSALNPSVAVANPPANPVVPQPPKPVVHAPPVVVNPKKDAPPPVVVQQSNTPAAVAARYRVMAPAAPSAPQRVQVSPQQRPSSAPKVAPPKSVDQIIREILNRDNERYRQNPVQQKVPVNNPNFNKPNVAVAQKQPVVANRPDSRGAPVIRQQPVKAPVPVQQNPVKMEVKANNNGNPFQAIVGGKPLALNQREPEKKPIVAAPKPAVPAQRKADDPPSNRRQEEKPRASPVVVTPSNNAAKVPMPNKVNKPPPDIEIVAAPPAARRIPVSRYNQPNAILPSPSQSPSVGNDDISVASKESNVSNAYRSPQVPLSQQRQIAVKSEGNSDRVGKIDAIIEKAAAVLEVIKKEKLKSEQMKIARQNTPSSNDREDYGYKEPPSRAAPSLQQYQPPQINRVVAAPSSSRQSMPAAVTPSNVSPVPSGAKADLPWLQNLQNQMGALKVQVQKLQDNKNSPIPSDPPSDLSPPPFQQSPAPAPAPAPVAQLRKPPTVPSTRQSFPLDKNAISISSKNPSVVSKESNYSAGSNISNKKGPVKSITKPASVVSGSNKNNGGVKKPVEGVKGKVNSGTTNANKGKGENKKLKVSVQKKKKEPEGPSSKELLEQRKEMRQKHQMGFKEFLKAQREAKKRGGDEGAMGDDDEKEDDEESGDEDLEEQDDDEVEDEEQEDNEENEDFEEENDEYSQREADSAELSYDERNHSHDPIAAQKADVYIAPLSSASYENIEVTTINSNFPEKGNKKMASAKSVSRSSNDGDQSTGTTPTALNTTSSKYLQNPKFRQSFPSKDNVNVLIDDNIEILSPPKPPTTRQMQPPPLPLPGNNSGTSSAASSARSHYHIPEGVTDSKNFYKSRSNVSLQGANNSPVISVEESNDACCGKVFTNMFRSNNTNANANSQINAKIVPTSPIRGRNMAFEFTEEELKNTNNKSMSDRSKAKAMLDEDENGELPEQSEADREREQYDMELDYQEQLLLQHPLINSEETEERDTEEEDYLGKSFVLQVQSNQKDNMEIDEETALEYSMMLQQMQEILQLPSQKSFMSPMKSSPRALEAVKEGENEEEDDDDCFEEKAFTFYLSDSDEEDAQKEGEAYMEEFEIEQDDNNEPVELLHEPRTHKSFLTQHLSYTHTIPKPKPKVKDTEDVVEESQADVEVDSLNADRHEDDYQTLIEDSLQLSQRLIDLLGYEVFSRGMSFLSSNEMIDESLDEDEILVKLEGILGVENLAYIEEMYQLLTYQQLIQEEEKGRLSQKEEAEEEIISERNRRPIRDVALEEI